MRNCSETGFHSHPPSKVKVSLTNIDLKFPNLSKFECFNYDYLNILSQSPLFHAANHVVIDEDLQLAINDFRE